MKHNENNIKDVYPKYVPFGDRKWINENKVFYNVQI